MREIRVLILTVAICLCPTLFGVWLCNRFLLSRFVVFGGSVWHALGHVLIIICSVAAWALIVWRRNGLASK